MELEQLFLAKRIVPVVLLALLWFWESEQPFFGQKQGRLGHAAINLALAVFNAVLIILAFGGLIGTVSLWTETNQFGLLNQLPLNGLGRGIVGFLLLDAWMYLWHRANHAVPILWYFHRLHHSDRHMDVTTATRFHPGELIASSVVRLALIPLLGLDLWLMVGYEVALVAVTQVHHADISLGRCDRWLRWLIVTPDLHKVHHSEVADEHETNFSSVLSIWDWLAGTLRLRADLENLCFGLKEETPSLVKRKASLGWLRFLVRDGSVKRG